MPGDNLFAASPEQMRRAWHIADAAVVTLVEAGGALAARLGPLTWYTVEELFDASLWPVEILAEHRMMLEYGLERGLLVRHPTREHWVRIDARSVQSPPAPASLGPVHLGPMGKGPLQ